MDKTTELAKGYTVQNYLDDIQQLDATPSPGDSKIKNRIANFFVQRFTERYISPINAAKRDQKHGFCTMAVSCLMIEALQCFWTGQKDTRGRDKQTKKGRGQIAFDDFFHRTPSLNMFEGTTFYADIRCGILHQAETNNGWKLNRLNKNGRVIEGSFIDATKFHRYVEVAWKDHADLLRKQPKDSERWQHFRHKMNFVCKNC